MPYEGETEHRIKILEEDVHGLKEKNSKDHEKFFNRLEALEKETAVANKDLEYIKETVDEINGDLKSLMETPGKRYETIVACVITTVVGVLIGAIMSGVIPV